MSQNMFINVMDEKKKSDEIPMTDKVSIVKEIKKDAQNKDVRLLFHMVKDILNRAIQNVNSNVMDTRAYMEDVSHQQEVIHLREKFNYKLDRISYEIASSTSSRADTNYTTDSILKILSEYSSEAKLILTLTAFALNYGECWHLALTYSSRQLAKSMVKQVGNIHKQPGLSSPPLEAINDLVMAIMDVTSNIIEFKKMGEQLVQLDESHESLVLYSKGSKEIPSTIYWTVKSVLVSASKITRLISMGLNYVISSTEKTELIGLTDMLNEKKRELLKWQNSCKPTLEVVTVHKRLEIIKSLIEVPQVDNMNILRALFYCKDDQPPLILGRDQKQADLEVLRKKLVLLLISDLDISQEDIDIVNEIHSKSRDKRRNLPSRFEIVWLPIIDPPQNWNWEKEETKDKFKKMQKAMEWYTVGLPSLIAKEVIKLAKDEWHFKNQPIIVVIDAQGQVACPNAFPMIYIWRYEAYPFTITAEEALWNEKSWDLELLMGDIYPPDLESNKSRNNYICLCGGKNIEWIKMFTTRAPAVAKAVVASWEMVYVGKMSEPNETVQRHDIAAIDGENINLLTKKNQLKFWKRLVNMGHSRMQLGKTIYEDTIMQDIISLLHLDASGGGWAVICHDLQFMIKAKGKQILNSFINFFEWKDAVKETAFISALQNHLSMNPGQIDVIKHVESYERIIDIFGRTHKVDCMEVLKVLISAKDYWLPLVDGATKRRVNVDLLKRTKFLFLLVSDCNISREEIVMLENIYKERQRSDESEYEIVWLPIEDASKVQTKSEQFVNVQKQMPWYTVQSLSMIDQVAIKFIKEVWHFEKKPILVVLDQNGRVVSPNALHMIWKKDAISFITSKGETTTSREEAMWKKVNWGPDLIIANLDTKIKISDWVNEDKLICLYGGEDIKWIRNFTSNAKEAAKSANIPLEMLYVGKSNLKREEQVRRIIKKIKDEKLSHCWEDLTGIRFFWYRIQSMWHSKYQLGKSIEDDPIMQELTTILEFDSSEGGWAIMSKGSGPGDMAKAKGSDFLNCLLNYREWIEQASQKGFVVTLKEKLKEFHKPEDCYQLLLPEFAETKLDTTKCSHCHRTTERFITFKCCGK